MSLRALAKGSSLPPVRRDVMRIYSMRFCPYAQRTRIVLNYKNIPHELINVNLRRKPKWLWERNPNGLVPVLEYRDQIVYESAICDDFLDETFDGPRLTPTCPVKKAKHRMLMADFDKAVPSLYKLSVPEEDERTKARTAINRMFTALEKELANKKYFGGDVPSMLDFHIFPWFERLPVIKSLTDYDCVPSNQFPNLVRWTAEISDLPAVKETLYPLDWHSEFMVKLALKRPEYDIGLTANL